MSEEQGNPRIHPRRIIERPRLIQELESSGARIVLLVAGPGWGKTILAEQWSGLESVRAGWFRARSSAADVAVVARGIAMAAHDVMPGVGRRMLERLAATEDPEREAVLLAEMLVKDLEAWPPDGWLVLDNYDEIAGSRASEMFLDTLIAHSHLRVAVLSATRPMWAAGPGALKPESMIELRESSLGMAKDESDRLLSEVLATPTIDESSSGGWPALLALASMVPDVPRPNLCSAGALYETYATAVVNRLSAETHRDLMTLAVLPTLDFEVAGAVLGARAHNVCTDLVELGLIDERDQRFEIHPLLRDFLLRHATSTAPETTIVAAALRIYRQRRDWDSAFELVRHHALDDQLASFLLEAVDELLNSGRLSTLLRWTKFARTRSTSPHPVFEIAEIELHLRHGQHATALTKARSAIHQGVRDGDLAHRLTMVAARAAHAGGHEEEALAYYKQARKTARSVLQRRDARWGELMCLSALERPEAYAILDELVRSVVTSDARDQVRMADKQLSVGFRFGFVKHLADSRRAAELVRQVSDPFVRCSFLGVHSWALALGAYYEEALDASNRLLADTVEHRVDLVLTYAYSIKAVALAGLKDQSGAERAVDLADQLGRRINDENGQQNAYATRVRVLLQAGRSSEACSIEPPDTTRALPSMRGEVLGSRALALATTGRIDEAAGLVELAVRSTSGIEARALYAAVQAVCSVKRRSDDLIDRCETLIRRVFADGSADFAVTAYRANPELLSSLVASPNIRDEVIYLTRRAGDESLIDALGLSPSSVNDRVAELSKREHEVYTLLCEGLSNGEIAKRLFITQGTVKAHVHHVFDKLGIRSRSALALNAARERYATSAATMSGAGSEANELTVDPNPGPRAAR